MKKILLLIGAVFLTLVLSGCGQSQTPVETNGKTGETAVQENGAGGSSFSLNACKEEKVALPNYGDPGQRLKNCFVKYPGEPSRQDKSYYIVEDICGQFTKEFVENMYGAKLDRIELPKISSINNCTYYFDGKEYVMLNLEYLAVENQKKGNEFAGYTVEKNAKIPMDNLVAVQEDGAINVIYLILNPNKFLSLRPSSKKAIDNEKFITLAANIAQAIKGYK